VTHDPDLPAIRADRRQLEQVVMNLVVNARDAMPHGGEIAIETRVRKLSTPLARDRVSVPPGDYVVVSVSDEGCGIAPDKLPKIFEPFFTTKRPGEGTGLGLSTAYGIVKQSGGYIFADSAVGSGTCFSLYFPAHHSLPAAETAGPPPVPPSGIPPSVGTVLLVEDEAPVRAFAARALRLRGHKVIEVENAEEALATLGDPALQIDVFVSDVVMPGMDGPSWVREALRTRPGARVIFMSGYSEESVAKERLRIPNATFLPKPFSLAQLTEAVQAKLSP
jgi:two-component system cell cycle sensor histidine kinase/response regulator CckA